MNKRLKTILIITNILIFLLLINLKSIKQSYRAYPYRNVPYFLDLAKKVERTNMKLWKMVDYEVFKYFDSIADKVILFNGSEGIWKFDKKGNILDSIKGTGKFIDYKFLDGMLWGNSYGGGVSYWLFNGDTANYKSNYLELRDSSI